MRALEGRAPRIGDRLLGFFAVRLVIWLLAAKAFLPGVLLDEPYRIGYYHDEHGAVMEEETARRSIVEYHQAPAWNPWYCGGIFLTSTSNAYAPDFIFRVLFGTAPGRRVTALFFALLGMEGTFRYARKNGASAIGGALAGIAFACSGHFKYLLDLGWTFMFNYNLIPWAAFAFEQGLTKRRWLVAGGFVMAWLLVGGGTYALPYAALVLALLVLYETGRALFRAGDGPHMPFWRPALCLAIMAGFALAFSAIRLLPLAMFISSHTRGVEQIDASTPTSILAMVAFGRNRAAWASGAGDFYVGTYVFLFALVAGLLADRKAAKFWLIAFVFAAFACGEFIPTAPYVFMRKLPLFSQLRFPVRMLVVTSLFVALAASRGVTRIEDGIRTLIEQAGAVIARKKSEAAPTTTPLVLKILAGVVASGVVAYAAREAAFDVIEHNKIVPNALFIMPGPQEYKDDFRQSRGNRWDAQVWPFVNRGTLHCFHEHKLFESPYLRGDLPADEYGAPDTDTQVERVSWSPNKIVVRVRGTKPGRFVVNQNHEDGWSSDVGELHSDGGLISVRVPAGEHVVTLRYRNGWMTLGTLITALTMLGVAIWAGRRLPRRARAWKRWYRRLADDISTPKKTPPPAA